MVPKKIHYHPLPEARSVDERLYEADWLAPGTGLH